MPKVYNKKNRTGIPKDAVYVGRPTCWGNPFHINRNDNRMEVIAKFREYAIQRLEREPDWLQPLRGKDLVCWCAPLVCHADVLVELANAVDSTLD